MDDPLHQVLKQIFNSNTNLHHISIFLAQTDALTEEGILSGDYLIIDHKVKPAISDLVVHNIKGKKKVQRLDTTLKASDINCYKVIAVLQLK